MAMDQEAAELRTVLRGISWDTYESILRDHEDRSAPRFTYDRGTLEIMSPMVIHDRYKVLFEYFVAVLAEEAGTEIYGLGSTTFKREELERGFEPDACFYIAHIAEVHGKDRLDMAVDPPPDLVIEIDITHSSLDKLSIFRSMGVPEVWRYDGERLEFRFATSDGYELQPRSHWLPMLYADALAVLLREGPDYGDVAWIRRVRAWARALPGDHSA